MAEPDSTHVMRLIPKIDDDAMALVRQQLGEELRDLVREVITDEMAKLRTELREQ